ncbi:hypothetical protein DFH08DRAFT_653592, partial [Mycena albidolilacea]
TDADGEPVTVDVTSFFTPSPISSPSASSSNTAASDKTNDDDSGGGLSTGGIVGLAVAGGTALICLIGFLVWKLTRKRQLDFDDSENIKWPELNAHGGGGDHALPVTQGAGARGFIDGDDATSRAPSTYAASTADFHAGQDDPYAVPPLPHMNPGLGAPYRDDPNAPGGAYYDPYHGPVPQTFNEGVHGAPPADWGGEAIAMTQMGRASPGPAMMYAGDGRTGSPAPMMYADARTGSPGPQAAYATGRASPGPGPAYNTGRASPGPQAAYGGGRASPGPQGAY